MMTSIKAKSSFMDLGVLGVLPEILNFRSGPWSKYRMVKQEIEHGRALKAYRKANPGVPYPWDVEDPPEQDPFQDEAPEIPPKGELELHHPNAPWTQKPSKLHVRNLTMEDAMKFKDANPIDTLKDPRLNQVGAGAKNKAKYVLPALYTSQDPYLTHRDLGIHYSPALRFNSARYNKLAGKEDLESANLDVAFKGSGKGWRAFELQNNELRLAHRNFCFAALGGSLPDRLPQAEEVVVRPPARLAAAMEAQSEEEEEEERQRKLKDQVEKKQRKADERRQKVLEKRKARKAEKRQQALQPIKKVAAMKNEERRRAKKEKQAKKTEEKSDESGNKRKLSGIVSYGSKAEKEEAMKRKQRKQAQRRLQVAERKKQIDAGLIEVPMVEDPTDLLLVQESCAKRVVHSPTDELSPVSTRTVTEQNWKTSQSGEATVQDPFADDEFPIPPVAGRHYISESDTSLPSTPVSGPGFHTPSPPSTPGSDHSSPNARWADSPANTPQLLLEEIVEPAPRAKYPAPSTGIRQPLQQTLETATTTKSPHRQTLKSPAAAKSPHRQTLETPAAAKSPHCQTLETPAAAKSPHCQTLETPAAAKSPHRQILETPAAAKSPHCQTLETPAAAKSPHCQTLETPAAAKSPHCQTLETPAAAKSPHCQTLETPAAAKSPHCQTLETPAAAKSPHCQTLKSPAAAKSPHRQILETPAAAKSPHRQTSITPPATKSPYQKTVNVAVSPVRDHTLRRQVSSDSLRLSPECKTPAYLQKSRSYKDVVPRELAKGNGFRGKATYSSPPPSAYPTEGQQGGLREACERLVQRNQAPSATFHLPTELYKPPTTPLLTARPGMHSFAQSFGDFPKNTSSLLAGPCPRYPMNANRMQYVPEESRFTSCPPATPRQTGRVRVNQLWNGPPTLTGNSTRDTRRSAPMRGRMANVSATGNPMHIVPYKPNPSTASITEEPQKTVKNSRHVTITGHMAGQPGNTKSLPNVDAHFFER